MQVLGRDGLLTKSSDRRDGTSPTGGQDGAGQGDENTDGQGDPDGARLQNQSRRRERGTRGLEQQLQALGECSAHADPEGAGHQGYEQGLHQDRPQYLAAAGPYGAQQGEFPGALRDQHRERVVDQEGGHEQADDGEYQQEGVQESQTGVELLGDLVRLFLACGGLDPRGQQRLHLGQQSRLVRSLVCQQRDAGRLTGLEQQTLSRVEVPGDEAHAESGGGAQRRGPAQNEAAAFPVGQQDRDLVPGRDPEFLGRVRVQRDLVASPWRGTVDNVRRIEGRLLDPGLPDRRAGCEPAALGAQRLAGGIEDHDVGHLDLGDHDLRAGQFLELPDQFGGHSRGLALTAEVR